MITLAGTETSYYTPFALLSPSVATKRSLSHFWLINGNLRRVDSLSSIDTPGVIRQMMQTHDAGTDGAAARRFPLSLLVREPFRLFFPAATVAGIAGVSLWPLHLLGLIANYPGQLHARIMAHGLFAGFILGFLGTALPRMLSAPPLRTLETIPLLLLHIATVLAYAYGNIRMGNAIFLTLLGGFAITVAPRIAARKDLPPPGFLLVVLSLASAAVGALLAVLETDETAAALIIFQRLLTYQGFILFPILGIGPFILPRFFGLLSPHDFPEALRPTAAWLHKACLALAAGSLILVSFILEARGFYRPAYALRFVSTLGYMLLEMPLKRGPDSANAFGVAIRIALLGIVAGFLAIIIYPEYRVGLLHLTLVGGFAVITFVVATRVLFGHSGNLPLLKKSNRWFLVALALMLFGMATRISGDFWPKIMASHYIYGAILWIAGVLVWGFYALSKAFVAEEEE